MGCEALRHSPWLLPTIARVVGGSDVWDLGCGGAAPMRGLWKALGVKSAHMVDRELLRTLSSSAPEFLHASCFTEWEPPCACDVAAVLWPVNFKAAGLVDLLKRAPRVIYLGDNKQSSAGGSDLWAHLLTRPLEAVATLTYQPGTLLVYGEATNITRKPQCGEEEHALSNIASALQARAELLTRWGAHV